MWIYALMCSHPEPPSGWLFPFTNCVGIVWENAWSISGSISAIVCHLSTKQCYKSFTYHNENSPPPPLPACFIPLYKMFIDKAEMEMMVYPRILINLAHLSLRSGIWEAVILVPGPHPVVCGSAAILIYAVSWMQLFPVTTVAKEPWGCFRTQQELDTSLIRVYIRSLSFSCRQPAELKSECGLHFLTVAFSSHSQPAGCPHPLVFCFGCGLFISPILELSVGSPGTPASRSIGPIVYSLHPDTKDIKLTDQRAAAAGPTLINEALGRGWMDGGGWDGRRTGRLTDAQSARRSMGTFCWAQIIACAVSPTTSLLTAAFVSHLHELNGSLGDNVTKERRWKKRKKTPHKQKIQYTELEEVV